jgi:copper chaperone CopZ
MRTNRSLTTAFFLSASIAVLSLTLAQRCEAQDIKSQSQAQGQAGQKQGGPSGAGGNAQQGGAAKDGGTAGPKSPEKICLNEAQKAKLLELQIEDGQLDFEAKELEQKRESKRQDASDIRDKIAHLGYIIAGKLDMSDSEKADGLKPTEAKAEAEAELKTIDQEIEQAREAEKSKRIQQLQVRGKIERLEKTGSCDEPIKTVDGPKPPVTTGGSDKQPGGGQCHNATDEKLLAEYRELVALKEKDAENIQKQLKDLDGQKEAAVSPEVKQVHLEETSRQRAELNRRYIDDLQVIEKFKALIKAILDKKPCPEEKKTQSYVPRMPAETFVSLEEPGVPAVTISLIGRHGEHEHRRHERDGRHEHGRVERRHESSRTARLPQERGRLGRLHQGGRGGFARMGGFGHGMRGGFGHRMGGMGRMARR